GGRRPPPRAGGRGAGGGGGGRGAGAQDWCGARGPRGAEGPRLGARRYAERTADGHASEGARRPPELALDELAVGHAGNLVFVPPRGDAADDEELLAGLDEPEATRLPRQLFAGADRRQPVLHLLLLRAQQRHLGLAGLEH